MGLSYRRMPTWLTRRRRRERHRQWALRAVLLRGSAWCSRVHSEPPFSTSHSSSGVIGPLSTHSLRGQSDLLFLSRMSRRYGCSSRGCAPMYSHAIIVGSLVILHVIAQCHPSKVSNRVSRTRSSNWLISNPSVCTTPLSRAFPRELQ